MPTAALLMAGAVLLALAVGQSWVRLLPLSSSVIYLGAGAAAGWAWGPVPLAVLVEHPAPITAAAELTVLLSLIGVGLRLRRMRSLGAWRQALWLAGPGMVVAVLLGTLAVHWVLGLGWAAAWLLAALLAPTDPVLASDVQIRSETDRDAVRLALTAEGGLNDGTALPAVMLGLGFVGLHELAPHEGPGWWWRDLLWPVGGGALVGLALGNGLGRALRWRAARGDRLERAELLYVGALILAFGLARATGTSSFVVGFLAAVGLLWPMRHPDHERHGDAIAERLRAFGESGERLAEALAVSAIGLVLPSVDFTAPMLACAFVMVVAVRPLSVLAVMRLGPVTPAQRRLVAWFGIRGIGALFYLAFVLDHGVRGTLAETLIGAALTTMALSIVVHGVSATPLMTAYHRYWQPRGPKAKGAGGPGDGSQHADG